MTSDPSAALRPVVVLADTSHLESVVELDRLVFGGHGDPDQYAHVVERGDCFVALVDDAPLGFGCTARSCIATGSSRSSESTPTTVARESRARLSSGCSDAVPTDRLFMATSADNTAMQKTAEAFGFVPAGHIDGIDDQRELIYLKRVLTRDTPPVNGGNTRVDATTSLGEPGIAKVRRFIRQAVAQRAQEALYHRRFRRAAIWPSVFDVRPDDLSAARTDVDGHPAIMADVEEVEVVVAHQERATLRVGAVFLKIDADQTRTDVEVEAMTLAPIPTPEVLWRKPPVLALATLPGTALGRLGQPSPASPAAWAAVGAAVRRLHDAPLPPWPGPRLDQIAADLDDECEWLVANGVLPTDLVARNRRVAEAALRPWTPVFTHGDLQIAHVFVDGDEITGVVDWSEAAQGDALHDLAVLTLGHEEHLGDVVTGYGTDVDLDVIRGWWSLRSLLAVRWLVEHGFDPSAPGCEFDVLRSQL